MCEFESNLTGSYEKALDMLCRGKSRLTDDLEMRCAAIGIQSRIIAAQGNVDEALHMMDRLLNELPKDAPVRLRQNMQVHRMQLQLLTVTGQEALNWLEQGAPDETGDFVILDRYQYMLKLRLYIVTAQWQRIPLLTAQLRHYFDSFDRPYLRIQLHLLQAIIDYRTSRSSWQEEMRAALRYQMPENDTLNITFATDAGCFLEFTFYPLSTEGAAEVWTVVIASIQPE